MLKRVLALTLSCACSSASRAGDEPGRGALLAAGRPELPANSAVGPTLNGVRVGDTLQLVWDKRSDQLCDEDSIENQTARLVIFGDCRSGAPSGFAIYITTGGTPESAQTILAMGFLGTGPAVETVPPVALGSSLRGVNETLGSPQATFSLRSITATLFAGDVALLSEGETIVGSVFGPMPTDHRSERWRVFEQVQRRYGQHPAVVNAQVSASDCEKLLTHTAALYNQSTNLVKTGKTKDAEIKECQRHGTPEALACAFAAKTLAELRACK